MSWLMASNDMPDLTLTLKPDGWTPKQQQQQKQQQQHSN